MSQIQEIQTLADIPRFHAGERGTKVAFRFGDRETSYADFDRHCSQVANGLAAEGVGHGDRVAFLDRNSDHYFELFFGATRAGAVMVPVNWRLAAPEVQYIVDD